MATRTLFLCTPNVSIITLFCFLLMSSSIRVWASPRPQYTDDERRLLRNLFLRRFGLDHLVESAAPASLSQQIPDYVWKLYDEMEAEAGDAEHDLLRHFFSASSDRNRILFDLFSSDHSKTAENEQIVHANLRIRTEPDLRGQLNVRDGRSGKLLDSRRLPLWFSRDSWVDLDVSEFFDSPTAQRTAEFVLEFLPTDPSDILPTSELSRSAALVTYVRDLQKRPRHRRKRNANKSSSSSSAQRKHRKHRKHHNALGPRDNSQCRRTKLYVDFSELNWDEWIMAPAGYDAYQCQGQCSHPMGSRLNATNHAIIQSLIHSIDPSAVPPPSCVPTETSSISILYRDVNNTVVVKNYADMRVDACGCH